MGKGLATEAVLFNSLSKVVPLRTYDADENLKTDKWFIYF